MSLCHEISQCSVKDKFHSPHGLTCPHLVAEDGTAGCPGNITVRNERVERFSDYGAEPWGRWLCDYGAENCMGGGAVILWCGTEDGRFVAFLLARDEGDVVSLR